MNRIDSFLILAGVALAGASSASASQAAAFAASIQPGTPGVDSLVTSMIWGWVATSAVAVALGLAGGYRAIRSGVVRQPLLLAFFLVYSLTGRVDDVSLGWPWQIHVGLVMGRVGLGLNLVGVALLAWYLRACARIDDASTNLRDASDTSFLAAYLAAMACQAPIWLCGGLVWSGVMIAVVGTHPARAFVGGLGWAVFMWLLCGNMLAVGLAWRRTSEFHAPDRAEFRAALDRACGRLRLKVLAESPDEVVLGPQRALVRFRLQEVRVAFAGGEATVTGSALSCGVIRKALARALAESPEVEPG